MAGHASFKVAWNKLDPSKILMSSSNNHVFLLEIDSPGSCKSLEVKTNYPHHDSVFGVAWSPANPSQFLTGCKDGKMRLYDVITGNANPIKTFMGHLSRIYNVLYNPLLPHIAASGSDDCSIMIWDISAENSSEPIQILGGVGKSNSHSNNVRALEFMPEISWCLMTGSWDALIKLWDIRSG